MLRWWAAAGVFVAVIGIAVTVLVVRAGSEPDPPARPRVDPLTATALPFMGNSGKRSAPVQFEPYPGVCAGPAQSSTTVGGDCTAVRVRHN